MWLRLWNDLAKHRKRSCGRDVYWQLKSVGFFWMSNGRLSTQKEKAERKKKIDVSNPIQESVLQMGFNNKAMKYAWANNMERNMGVSWQLEAQKAKKRKKRKGSKREFIMSENRKNVLIQIDAIFCHVTKKIGSTTTFSRFSLRPPGIYLPYTLTLGFHCNDLHLLLLLSLSASLPVSRHQACVITNTPSQPPSKNCPGWYSLHLSPRSSCFPTAAGSATSGRVIKPDWALWTWLGSRYEARQQRDESGGRREQGAGGESGMKDRKTETGCLSFSKAAFTSTSPLVFCGRVGARRRFCWWSHHSRLASHLSSVIVNIRCRSIHIQMGLGLEHKLLPGPILWFSRELFKFRFLIFMPYLTRKKKPQSSE